MITIEHFREFGETRMNVDDAYAIITDYLNEYQQHALNDAISAFGYNMNTLNSMLYVWFGMETEAFIDEMLGLYYE